jgi:hypothetical protein
VRRAPVLLAVTAIMAACALFPDLGELTGDAGLADSGKDVVVEASNDAGSDAGVTCGPEAPFGPPQLVSELDDSDDNGIPHLTHDELTIYFQRSPSGDASAVQGGVGGIDLFTAARAKVTDPFGAATAVAVDSPKNEWDPSVTADDLSLYFASDRDGGLGMRDLYLSTRTSVVAAFGAPTTVATLNTPSDECCAYVMPDGLTMYFARQLTSDWQMFRATRTTTTAFSEDTSGIFDQINTTSVEQTPTVTLDELTVYYGSDRGTVDGNVDIWRATRASKTDPFTNAVVVTELSTPGYDYPGWISDDGCRLYFTVFGAAAQIFVAKKN